MSVLDAVPVEAIDAQARQVDIARMVLAVIAAVFYGIGRLVGALVLMVAWAATAVRIGYADGRGRGAHSRGRDGS